MFRWIRQFYELCCDALVEDEFDVLKREVKAMADDIADLKAAMDLLKNDVDALKQERLNNAERLKQAVDAAVAAQKAQDSAALQQVTEDLKALHVEMAAPFSPSANAPVPPAEAPAGG